MLTEALKAEADAFVAKFTDEGMTEAQPDL